METTLLTIVYLMIVQYGNKGNNSLLMIEFLTNLNSDVVKLSQSMPMLYL